MASSAARLAVSSEFHSQSIANTLQTHGKASYKPAAFLSRLQFAVHAQKSTPQSTANSVWPFTVLEWFGVAALDALLAASLSCISEFSQQNLANAIWTMGTLTY